MLATADHALAAVAMDVDGDASAAAPARPHCPPWAASCGDRALALLVTAAVVSAWRGAWLVCDACFLTRAPFQSAMVGLALGGTLFLALMHVQPRLASSTTASAGGDRGDPPMPQESELLEPRAAAGETVKETKRTKDRGGDGDAARAAAAAAGQQPRGARRAARALWAADAAFSYLGCWSCVLVWRGVWQLWDQVWRQASWSV